MKLQNLIKIECTHVTTEFFKRVSELASQEFEQYNFKYEEPYTWYESVPNPDYNPNIISRNNEETILEHREADCGFVMELKKVNHISFNIKCFLYQGSIYIFQGVYYYAHFNASNLESFIRSCLLPDSFTFGKHIVYNKKTYQQWVKEHPDQKWAQHNYKIDQEDLAKIGIVI